MTSGEPGLSLPPARGPSTVCTHQEARVTEIIAPLKTVTFTVTKVPRKPSQRETIQRLMRMQRDVQRSLKKLARRRR